MANREDELDERIISLQLENKDFEKNAEQTVKTLDKLQNAMDLDDGKGLSGASSSMEAFAAAADTAQSKFNLIDFAKFKILGNIIDNIQAKIEGLLKSLTIEPVTSGWAKYEEETASVQTIMAATKLPIEKVEEQLKKLSTFSDETSYSYADMTNNVGKFTSQNVDLETSVRAMEGIALWAAKSGQNSATAARAMYNMSQSLGVGSVKLMDWRSIENANMATTEFKQLVLDTAVSLGTLTKKDGKYYATVKQDAEDASSAVQASVKKIYDVTKNGYIEVVTNAGKAASKVGSLTEVSIENFSSTLSEGWFDKDVLLSTLDVYGNGVARIEKYMNDHGLRYMGEAVQAMKEEGYDFVNDIGLSSFIAAQEAKTWRDAVDSAKDAASTKWKDVAKSLFGNYDTAKVFFTDVANAFYDWFIEPLNRLNEILDKFNELGGGEEFRGIAYDIMDAVYTITEAVNTGLGKVWKFFDDDVTTGNAWNLLNFVYRIRDGLRSIGVFTEDENGSLVLTERASATISEIVYTLAYTLSKVGKLFRRLISGAFKIAKPVAGFAGELVSFLADIVTYILDLNDELGITDAIGNAIGEVLGLIESILNMIFGKSKIGESVEEVNENTEETGENLETIEISIDKISKILDTITTIASALWDNIKKIGSALKELGSILLHGIFGEDIADGATDMVVSFINTIGNAITKVIEFITYLVKLTTGAEDLDKAKTSVKDFFKPFVEFFTEFDERHPEIYSALLTIWGWVKTIIGFVWDWMNWTMNIVKSWIEDATLGDILSAIFIAMVIQIGSAIKSIAETVADTIGAIADSAAANKYKSLALVFLGIAAAILAFAVAIKIINDIPDPGPAIATVIGLLILILAAVVVVAIIVKKLSAIPQQKKTFTDIIAGVLGQNKTPIDAVSKLLLSIAVSLIIIVLAIKMLAKAFANEIYGDKILGSIIAIAVLLVGIFAGVIFILKTAADIEKGALNGLWLIILLIVIGLTAIIGKVISFAKAVASYSWGKILSIGGAIALIFVALGGMVALIAHSGANKDTAKVIKSVGGTILALGIVIGVLAWLLTSTRVTWKDMAIAAGIISGTFLVFSLVSRFLLNDIKPAGIWATVVAIIALGVAIIAVMWGIKKFLSEIDPKQLWNAAGAVAVLLGGLMLIFLIMAKIGFEPANILLACLALVVLTAAILAVSYALYYLSDKADGIWTVALAVMTLVAVFALLALGLGALTKHFGWIWAGIAALAVIAGLIYLVSDSLYHLASRSDSIWTVVLALGALILVFSLLALGIGALVSVFPPILLGVAVLFLLALTCKILADACYTVALSLELLKKVIGDAWFERFMQGVASLADKLRPLGNVLSTIFGGLFDALDTVLKPIFDLLGDIAGIVADILGGIGDLIGKGWNALKKGWNDLWGIEDEPEVNYTQAAQTVTQANATMAQSFSHLPGAAASVTTMFKGSSAAALNSAQSFATAASSYESSMDTISNASAGATYGSTADGLSSFVSNIPIDTGSVSNALSGMFSGVDASGLTDAMSSALGGGANPLEGLFGGENGGALDFMKGMLSGDGTGIKDAFTSAIGVDTDIGQMMSGETFGENFMSGDLTKYFSGEAFAQNPAFSNPVEVSQNVSVKHEFPVLHVEGTSDEGTITRVSNDVLAKLRDEVVNIVTGELAKEARVR